MKTEKDVLVDDFHRHLDTCHRCRTQPFNLCPSGARKLQIAASGTPPSTGAPDGQ